VVGRDTGTVKLRTPVRYTVFVVAMERTITMKA
jgi:hypothetical protein